MVPAPQSQGAQHETVPSHEGYGGPATSETSLDGASHPVGMGEDVSVCVQVVQPLGFPLMGGHVLQPRRHRWWGQHSWGYPRWKAPGGGTGGGTEPEGGTCGGGSPDPKDDTTGLGADGRGGASANS